MTVSGKEVLTAEQADALLMAVVLDDEVRQDPVPTYRRLIEEMPHWKSDLGMTVVTRYADCLELLRNPRWGRAEDDMDLAPRMGGAARRPEARRGTMLVLNPPDHTRLRGLVSRAFTPKRVEALRPRISEMLAPILDEVAQAGECDMMSTLAIPFPVAVISALLGVPQHENSDFVGLIRDTTAFIDAAADDAAIVKAEAAIEQVSAFFAELIEKKRINPDDALLSALIEVEAEGDRLDTQELIANSILMYAAGFETTSNLIGNGLRALITHPDELAKLRANRSLMSSAVWEILRFDSPVQLNVRVSLGDNELFGEPAPRGTHTMILQGSGNHDPGVYDQPEEFRVDRFVEDGVATPLSFGFGAHHCLGAHLARAEGEIIFGQILDRFSAFEIVGAEPRYRPSFTLRGLDQLRLKVTSS